MNINLILWIFQGLAAVLFLMAGIMKAAQPKEKLAENMAWVTDFTPGQIRTIGVLEILGAIGLVLPGITGLLTWLTPLAAVGLVLTMIGAMVTHLRRKENSKIAINLVLLLLVGFIAYGHYFIA